MRHDDTWNRCGLFCIIPPYIFEKMLESQDDATREAALQSMLLTSQIRGERLATAGLGPGVALTTGNGRRTVFDCKNSFLLSEAVLARSEDGPASSEGSVNRLFDGLGTTREFLSEIFNRNSLDDRGGRLDGYVHYGYKYNNATFDGSVMRFGDGDQKQFTDFTLSLDVIAHELGHGVTQYTSDLVYRDQPGALNESFSDVFGSLVKQWSNNETVEQADWLIGKDIWTPGVNDDALRSLKSPGKAYVNHPLFGTDPQPDHINKIVNTTGDNGGVHINSGIPNKAFHEVAMLIGGSSWEVSGHIWYQALQGVSRKATFQEFAIKTYEVASAGWGAQIAQSVSQGWKEVGIATSSPTVAMARRSRTRETHQEVSLVDLMNELSKITKRLDELEKGTGGGSRRR